MQIVILGQVNYPSKFLYSLLIYLFNIICDLYSIIMLFISINFVRDIHMNDISYLIIRDSVRAFTFILFALDMDVKTLTLSLLVR